MILIQHLIKVITIQFIISTEMDTGKLLLDIWVQRQIKKTETITWTSTLPSQTGRQRRCNDITEQISCLKGAARNVTSGEDCFDLFFSDGMFK